MTHDPLTDEADRLLRDRVVLPRPAVASGATLPAGAIGTVVASDEHALQLAFSGGTALQLPREASVPLRRGVPPATNEAALLFCTAVGSHAHGLATDASDVDLRGCYAAGPALHFSLDGPPEQLVHDDDQLCFWEFGKFLRLALKANPTVLETLYSPLVCTALPEVSDELFALRDTGSFLSRRASVTFLGYAESQFERMTRARARGGRIKWQHAMHLIRLLEAGTHLLTTGRLELRVEPERRAELLAIKHGKRTWEQVVTLRARLSAAFENAASDSPLPEQPDTDRVNDFLIRTRRKLLVPR